MQNILIDTNTAEFIHIDLGKPSGCLHCHTFSIHASYNLCIPFTTHNYVFMYVKEKGVVAVPCSCTSKRNESVVEICNQQFEYLRTLPSVCLCGTYYSKGFSHTTMLSIFIVKVLFPATCIYIVKV